MRRNWKPDSSTEARFIIPLNKIKSLIRKAKIVYRVVQVAVQHRGKPNGCQSNGGCSSGGCNRMNAYDWLRNLPIADMDSTCKVISESFSQGTRKDFFGNTTLQPYERGDLMAVEGVSGFDVGEVSRWERSFPTGWRKGM